MVSHIYKGDKLIAITQSFVMLPEFGGKRKLQLQ